MADAMLRRKVDLRHRSVEIRQKEERVVAETLIAARNRKDLSFNRAIGGEKALAISRCGEDTAIAALPLTWHDILQTVEEMEVIEGVVVRFIRLQPVCRSFRERSH